MQKCIITTIIVFLLIIVVPIDSFKVVATYPAEDNFDRILLNDKSISKDGMDESKAFELMSGYFIKNEGQILESDHHFYSRGGDIHFLADGVLMRFRELEPKDNGGLENDPLFDLLGDHRSDRVYEDKGVVLKLEFEDANDIIPHGRNRCSWNTNYFKGCDPAKWYTDVANYREIIYKEVWDGIDIIYKSKDGKLKYDIIISPGADPSQIQIKIEGSQEIKIDNSGDLMIKTEYWNIYDTGLFAYYEKNEEELIESKFELKDIDSIGFSLGEYDRSKCIIIDPLIYSTYIGGSGRDYDSDFKVDSSGAAYITGYTDDHTTDYPTTSGAYNTTHNGNDDVFVTKLNSSGSSLIFSTFIGGTNDDCGNGIVIDSSGNAYLSGSTSSTDYPTTSGSYDTTHNGNEDIFVTKLNSSGSSLTPIFAKGLSLIIRPYSRCPFIA